MRRLIKIIFAALALCITIGTNARTIRDFFIGESGDIFKQLSTTGRSDMLAYYDVNRIVPTQGSLGELASLVKVTPDYLKITTSKASEMEMALLPISKRDTAIVVISTVTLPARDSRIMMYDTKWQPMELEAADFEDFVNIPKKAKIKKADVLNAVRFPIISYSIDSISKEVTARHGLRSFMSKEEYEKIAPYLDDSLVYEIKGKRLKLKR